MKVANSSKLLVTIGHMLAFFGVGMWMFFIFLFLQYDATRSIVPRPAEGRIYESNDHGHVVYLTAKEDGNLEYLQVAALALFVVGALMGYYAEHPKRFGEVGKECWTFSASLSTTAGWSAVGRALRNEGASIVESVGSIFTGADKFGICSGDAIGSCRAELDRNVYLNGMNVLGDVRRDRIHLYVVRKDLRNSFAPHFYGKLRAGPSGTMIDGRFTMARFVMAFLFVWFGVVGVATFIVMPLAIEALVTGRHLVENPFLGAFFPPLMFLFGFLMVHWGYQLGKGDKAQIAKFLQRAVTPRTHSL